MIFTPSFAHWKSPMWRRIIQAKCLMINKIILYSTFFCLWFSFWIKIEIIYAYSILLKLKILSSFFYTFSYRTFNTMGYFVSKLYLLLFAGLFVFKIHSAKERVRNLSKTPQHIPIPFSKIFVTFSKWKGRGFYRQK